MCKYEYTPFTRSCFKYYYCGPSCKAVLQIQINEGAPWVCKWQPPPHFLLTATKHVCMIPHVSKYTTRRASHRCRETTGSLGRANIEDTARIMKAATIVSLALGLILPAFSIETVPVLDVEKYTGRWYQLYGNEFTARITRDGTCVAADYGLDQATGNITVINSSRIHSPTGELNTITGYAYGTDPSNPGQLKVHLGQVPQDGDYWVVGLGPASFGPDGLYEWAIVSGPDAESLFVLVRDVPEFEKTYARDVLALVVELGFTGRSKEPRRVIQEGCLPFHPTEFGAAQGFAWTDVLAAVKVDEYEGAYASDEDVNESGTLPQVLDVLSNMLYDDGQYAWTPDFSPVKPVTKLDIGRYLGRWYQVYSSLTVNVLLGKEAACVTADYKIDRKARNVACVNTARMGGPDGELAEIEGYAYVQDKTKPGELTVHLDGVEAEAPYWIVALGNEDGNGPYTYTIVSDPLRAFLFVLVRDPEGFTGSQAETDLLAKCKELGFTSPWNSPRKTVQAGCSYPSDATKIADDKSDALSSVLNLRGGGFGCLPPLHASCKMTFNFPESSCEGVSDALVSSAESMMGFDSCNGGNKCGYTVGKVVDGSVELVHETSVKHYKDSLTFTLKNKGDSCEASAFSTSQTKFAVLDNSVNYCNLHNLVEASGLEYAENDVSDCSCTQYSTADCERY